MTQILDIKGLNKRYGSIQAVNNLNLSVKKGSVFGLLGPNGSGKTNVLDAIHYLSLCKSYFNNIDSQNIKDEEPFFVIEGDFEKAKSAQHIYCAVKRGEKKVFKKNKKNYERLADHIGHFPSVIISPYDRDLITEGSDVRRKFMDSVISQSDPVYLDNLVRYNKALQQRNALLKYFADADLSKLQSEDDKVYFNFPFLKMISYPFSWIWPMWIFALVVFIISISINNTIFCYKAPKKRQ